MDNLIRQALEFTDKKHQEGLLVWNEIPEFDNEAEANDWWITPKGDRETLYSIAGLYSQFAPEGISADECRETLEDVLCEKYPKYCD
jgi:hypothetical protein